MARFQALLGSLLIAPMFACAQAGSVDEVRNRVAHLIYEQSAALINREAPQPLLRAVVVMRLRMGAEGRWLAEVMRENDEQPEMTRRALDSVSRLVAPVQIMEGLRADLERNGFVEAWLFQNDGRFALKTLALPQRGE